MSETSRKILISRFFENLKQRMIEQHREDYKTFVEIYGEDAADECLYTKDGLYNPLCKTKIVIR